MCRFVICDRRRQSVKQDVHRTVSLCIFWISIAVYSFFSMIQTPCQGIFLIIKKEKTAIHLTWIAASSLYAGSSFRGRCLLFHLCVLDDLLAGEFFPLLLLQCFGDEFDIMFKSGDHDVLQRICTFL